MARLYYYTFYIINSTLFTANGSDGLPVVPTEVVPVVIVRTEAHVARTARRARVERRTPIVAVRAVDEERRTAAEARSRQENVVTVSLARYFVTIHTIKRCPSPCAFSA